MKIKMPGRMIFRQLAKYVLVYLVTSLLLTTIFCAVFVNEYYDRGKEVFYNLSSLNRFELQSFLDGSQASVEEARACFYSLFMVYGVQNSELSYENWGVPDAETQTYVFSTFQDLQTGEILTTTTQDAYLRLLFGEEEKAREIRGFDYPENYRYSKKYAALACPMETLETLFQNKIRRNVNDISGGELRKLVLQSDTLRDFLIQNTDLEFQAKDFYYRVSDGTFLPGEIVIYRDGKEELGILDLTPEEVGRDYVHEENLLAWRSNNFSLDPGEAVSQIWFPSISGKAGFPDESFQEEAAMKHYGSGYIPRLGGLFPETLEMSSYGTIKDKTGKSYAVYSYARVDHFSLGLIRGIRKRLVTGNLALLGFFTVICGFLFLRKKQAYETVAYRKMLMNVMAHDLKTPLTALEGYAESLKENLNAEKRAYYAEEIENNVSYLNRIISENLSLSKYENEERRIVRKPVDLVELCGESVTRLQSRIKERGLQVKISGEATVRGDRELLQRAFDNLVQNAVTYADAGSEILIAGEGHRVTIQNKTDRRPEGKLVRLWEPFVRGTESRSGEKGMGLGLYVAGRILKQHKWKYGLSYDENAKTFTCKIWIPWGVIW